MDKIFDFILIIICIIFNALIFILSKDYNIKITIITFIFTIAILVLFYLKKRNFTRYMNDILVKLSDMLSTISDMREEEVFSMIDDSMFSKLQHQTLKLINILKAQNKKIREVFKHEIVWKKNTGTASGAEHDAVSVLVHRVWRRFRYQRSQRSVQG